MSSIFIQFISFIFFTIFAFLTFLSKSIKSNFLSLKSSDKINVNTNKNNNIENNNDIKYSKTQKKLIAKVPKSLDIKKGENIVGIIQGKIKNILKDDFNLKLMIKKMILLIYFQQKN